MCVCVCVQQLQNALATLAADCQSGRQEKGEGGGYETGAHLELDTQTIQAENCLTQLLHGEG